MGEKPVSKAQQTAVNRYKKANYKCFRVEVRKAEAVEIEKAAAEAGESTAAYFREAVRRRMERGD